MFFQVSSKNAPNSIPFLWSREDNALKRIFLTIIWASSTPSDGHHGCGQGAPDKCRMQPRQDLSYRRQKDRRGWWWVPIPPQKLDRLWLLNHPPPSPSTSSTSSPIRLIICLLLRVTMLSCSVESLSFNYIVTLCFF